jgi:hypothetical protein
MDYDSRTAVENILVGSHSSMLSRVPESTYFLFTRDSQYFTTKRQKRKTALGDRDTLANLCRTDAAPCRLKYEYRI